jgi:hypothetical protein
MNRVWGPPFSTMRIAVLAILIVAQTLPAAGNALILVRW